MVLHRKLLKTALAITLFAPLASTAACGGAQTEVKRANVQPGEMPEGADWAGVYYSPTFGHLHLLKEGAMVNGKWRTAAGDKWGELHGEVDGDLLRYEWKETTIGMIGPTATKTGQGYFKYVRPPGDNVEDEIQGEWGLGSADAGNPWTAIKQRNVKPDPDSVMPDETQKVHGDAWDEGGSGASASAPDDDWD